MPGLVANLARQQGLSLGARIGVWLMLPTVTAGRHIAREVPASCEGGDEMAEAGAPETPVVAVAASAGGVEALSSFAASLPAEFSAAVLVVLHIPSGGRSALPKILSRVGKLPARHPADGEPLTPGVILVAPPDRHMVVNRGKVHLIVGARENGHRPAADVLMRSVAESLGPRCAGVVLSGTMDDGAAGLSAVRAAGGLTLVQDPEEAAFAGMPGAAIQDAVPQFVGPVARLADRICDWLAGEPATPREEAMRPAEPAQTANPGHLTPLTCPECGGTLWHHDDYGAPRYRCRVGHAFSADNLMLGNQAAIEAALWAAIVALDERADLARRVVKRLESSGGTSQVARYRQDIAAAEQRAEVLRGLVGELVHGVSSHEDEGSIVDSA
jgi:two-component system, chemotaxis family, protein-glutamate methylesterase/glutaminase